MLSDEQIRKTGREVYGSEIDRLRAEQAAGVMPQIGPLLDAWDGMDNDTKAVLREEAPDLARALVAISRAMDGTAGVEDSIESALSQSTEQGERDKESGDEHPAEEALRAVACWLGVGGYNAPTVDAEAFKRKIMEGVSLLTGRTLPQGHKAMPLKALRKLGVLIEAPWADEAAPEVLRRIHRVWDEMHATRAAMSPHGDGVNYTRAEGGEDGATGVQGTPAHSKSEYKRRKDMGDPNVLPPVDGVKASHPSPTIQGVIDGMTKLIDQWHDGPNNPDMWMAAAAGALSGARALLQDAPEVANGVDSVRRAEAELEEMRQHGNADDATEAAAHLERAKHAHCVKRVGDAQG